MKKWISEFTVTAMIGVVFALILTSCAGISKNTVRQSVKQACLSAKLAPVPKQEEIEKMCDIGARVDDVLEVLKSSE